MKNLTEKIAHGIVGWNNIEYLSNAIDSILFNRIVGEPLYVIITGGNLDDFNMIIKKYQSTPNIYIREVEHDPKYASKTGSLYHGYNQLFAELNKIGYRYLNLLQSDIQLFWWDQDILSHYLSILKKFDNSVQVITCSPKLGTNPGAYKTELTNYKILQDGHEIYFQVGIGDWGFFDLERWFKNDFYWVGTEESMSAMAGQKGIVSPLARVPCAADIPWPSVIRGGREVGVPIKRTEMLLLKGVHENTLNKLKTTKCGAIWYEDWVRSWGWWALQPTWNTEFTFIYLLRIFKSIFLYRNFKYAWTSYGKKNRFLPPFHPNTRPQVRDIFHMMKGVVYIVIYKISPRMIKFFQKILK